MAKKPGLRTFILPLLFALGLAAPSVHALADGRFYRIIDGANPGPRGAAIDRYIYGAEVLYTGDANPESGPIKVEGTVWHSNLAESRYFIGTHNPVIEQRAILERIESNKWEEAKLLMEHVPEAFPKTESLADIIRRLRVDASLTNSKKLALLSSELRNRYPDGFFLKPVSGFSSDGTFPSDKSNFVEVYEAYLRDVKPVIDRRFLETGGDTDTVHLELKRTANYSGRVLDELLARPENVIVQAKLDPAIAANGLIVEYRVHVVQGRVLTGATETRWEDTRGASSRAYAEVEAFTQRMINRLPPEMRGMCFGMDIMLTRDGRFMIIELNAGGESGYLYPDTDLWVAQLLAKRFRGQTALLAEFERFSKQPNLQAKENALARLLKRPELAELAAEGLPLSELLTHAKEVLLEDFNASPTRANAQDALWSLKRFKLEPYLTASEIQRLASRLHDQTSALAPSRLPVLAERLQLQQGEVMFVDTRGQVQLVNGINYDDAAVRDALLNHLREKLGASYSPAKARAETRKLVDHQIATDAELAGNRFGYDRLAKNLTLHTEAKLYFGGGRSSLVRELLAGLLRR